MPIYKQKGTDIMKFRRTLSAMTALSLMLSGTSIVAYADSAAEEAMKKELTYVKQRITVPEDLTEFSHRKYTNYGRDSYHFTWNTDPEKYTTSSKEISVEICGKVIKSYNRYEYDWSTESKTEYSFAKLSETELYNKAYKWIKILNPTVYNNIEIDRDSLNINLRNERAGFSIRRVCDGVPVKGQEGYITINKDTGELISYGLDWAMGAGFPDADDAITKEAAIEAFSKEVPVEKVYYANYDWQTKEYTPVLIYRQTTDNDIDALTGKLTTFEGSYFDYDSDDVELEAAVEEDANPGAGSNGVRFTESELKKMEEEGALVTAEEMLENLKELDIFQLGEKPYVKSSNCWFDDDRGYYVRNMHFVSEDTVYYIGENDNGTPVQKEKNVQTSANAEINAETGELLSFSSSSAYKEDGRKLTKKNSLSLLNKYVGILAGDKAEEFRLEEPRISWSKHNKDGSVAEDAYVTHVYSSSPRYAYGIPSMSENISISVNNDGKITDYNLNYIGIEYPKPDEILDEAAVYESYFSQIDYSLQYRIAIKKDVTYTAMVYNPNYNLYVDAFTGKLTNYNGSELVKYEEGSYTDLEGSKYEKVARKLEAYGIVLRDEQGRLNADEAVTRQEFSDLMSSVGSYYYNKTGGDKALTRQFAAKILTKGILSEQCAELEGVFRSPFSDVKEDSKYVGYIAVANALGYMKGKNGKFNPGGKITRGEALVMLYNRLAV